MKLEIRVGGKKPLEVDATRAGNQLRIALDGRVIEVDARRDLARGLFRADRRAGF